MTPTIKRYYRHFNAFLQANGVKQIFWKNIQLEANKLGESYNIRKTKFLHRYSPKYWIMNAFCWTGTDFSPMFWAQLNLLWEDYYESH